MLERRRQMIFKATCSSMFFYVRTRMSLTFHLAQDSNPVLNFFCLKPEYIFLLCLRFDIFR